MSVPGAVRYQNAELVFELLDLPVERINPIPPAAMKKNQRPPAPKFAVVNRDRTEARGVPRMNQLEGRHLVFPLSRKPIDRAQCRCLRRGTHSLYLTIENCLAQAAENRTPNDHIASSRFHMTEPSLPTIHTKKNGWQQLLPAASFLSLRLYFNYRCPPPWPPPWNPPPP